jgi:hypothetical protein
MTPMVAILLLLASPAHAAGPTGGTVSPYQKQEAEIPQLPKAPAPIPGGSPSDTFRCTRYFTWQGKKFECDSFVRQDAENLRTIVANVPQAVTELDDYQATRSSLKNTAYIGSAGLVLFVAGLLLHGRFSDEAPAGQNISRGISILGLGAAGGSFIYALGQIQANELRLGSAVQYYNTAHPDTPVELQFSTGFAF